MTNNAFDVRTIVFISAIMLYVLGLLMVIYWRSRITFIGFGYWVAANFAAASGLFLIVLRGQIPDLISVILSNTLILYSLVLTYEGFQRFFNRRGLNLPNHLLLLLFVILQTIFTYVIPRLNLRIALVSAVVAILSLRISLVLLRGPSGRLRTASRNLAILFLAVAVVSAARVIYGLLLIDLQDVQADQTLAAFSFAAIGTNTVLTFYFFFINSARLELDLLDAKQNLEVISEADRRKLVRLGVLEEASREIAESMDEIEIMQRTVRAVVNRFGYAEAAISLLVDEHQLEIAAIDGTEDIGFKPGYRQMVGEGIIGHTAETRAVYMTGDIETDPFYYSIGRRSGSAACVPMLSSGQLLGVLYVESVEKNAFVQDDVQTLETLVSHAVTAIQKARLFARTQTQLRAITTMQSVSQTILSSLELPDIFQSVVQLLKDNFNYTYVSIYMLQGDVLRLGAQAGYPEEMILYEIPVTSGITGRSVQTRLIQFVHNVAADPAFLRASNDIESEICVPLLKDDQVLGVINVEAAPGHPLTDQDVALLTVLRGPILIAIENAHLHSKVKQLALTDGLTGLYNRRAFDEMLESEIERASRYQHPLTLVIIDMDNFKDYNDLWGHPAGDERLESVADLLHSNLRSPDIVARYGGEEFAMILPNTTKSSALVLAERLRVTAEACAAKKDDSSGPIPGYTFSMGIATFPDDGQTTRTLLLAADQAEHAAKRLGKNRVVAAGIEPTSPNPAGA